MGAAWLQRLFGRDDREHPLLRSKAGLKTLLDNSPAVLLLIDGDVAENVYRNDAAVDMMKLTIEANGQEALLSLRRELRDICLNSTSFPATAQVEAEVDGERSYATLTAAGEDAVAVRLGGEEFLLVLPDIDAEKAVRRCEQLRRDIHSHDWRPVTGGLPVTASIGVTTTGADTTASTLLAQADRNLYAAKRGGRNRVVADPAEPTTSHPDRSANGSRTAPVRAGLVSPT